MKQLLGEDPTADKLSAALAASMRRAYLVVMKEDRYFTLIHHLTMLDVELRPQDPIKGRLVAFEADVLYDVFPPLAGNVGDMSATCRRQGEMSPIFVPTGQFRRHVSLVSEHFCVVNLPTSTYQRQTI